MKNIQKIQSAVLVIILLLTLHNTYKIHSVKDTSSVEQDMSAFAEGINMRLKILSQNKKYIKTYFSYNYS